MQSILFTLNYIKHSQGIVFLYIVELEIHASCAAIN